MKILETRPGFTTRLLQVVLVLAVLAVFAYMLTADHIAEAREKARIEKEAAAERAEQFKRAVAEEAEEAKAIDRQMKAHAKKAKPSRIANLKSKFTHR